MKSLPQMIVIVLITIAIIVVGPIFFGMYETHRDIAESKATAVANYAKLTHEFTMLKTKIAAENCERVYMEKDALSPVLRSVNAKYVELNCNEEGRYMRVVVNSGFRHFFIYVAENAKVIDSLGLRIDLNHPLLAFREF